MLGLDSYVVSGEGSKISLSFPARFVVRNVQHVLCGTLKLLTHTKKSDV